MLNLSTTNFSDLSSINNNKIKELKEVYKECKSSLKNI